MKLPNSFIPYIRYLVLGLIDAALTVISILTTSILLHETNLLHIFKLCMSMGIALVAANFGGAFLAEQAESGSRQAIIEKSMGVKKGFLSNTLFAEHSDKKSLYNAFVNSVSTLLGILLASISLLFLPFNLAIAVSIAISLAILAFIALLTASFSKQNLLTTLLKVAVIAIGVTVLNLLLGVA